MDATLSSRLVGLLLLLVVSPILLIVSTFGWRDGFAEGTLHLESRTSWGPPLGDISVHLGYFNASVTMSTDFGKVDMSVDGAKGWGVAVMVVSFIALGASIFIVYDQENEVFNIDNGIGTWVIRGCGSLVILLTFILYFSLAKTAHDEIQKKLESLQIRDQSLWPHPGLYSVSALVSGFTLLTASFFIGSKRIEVRDYERL